MGIRFEFGRAAHEQHASALQSGAGMIGQAGERHGTTARMVVKQATRLGNKTLSGLAGRSRAAGNRQGEGAAREQHIRPTLRDLVDEALIGAVVGKRHLRAERLGLTLPGGKAVEPTGAAHRQGCQLGNQAGTDPRLGGAHVGNRARLTAGAPQPRQTHPGQQATHEHHQPFRHSDSWKDSCEPGEDSMNQGPDPSLVRRVAIGRQVTGHRGH